MSFVWRQCLETENDLKLYWFILSLRAVNIVAVLFCYSTMWVFLLSQVGLADAVDLFRARKVFIKDGFAYVPFKEIDVIVLNNYRTKLSKALAVSQIKSDFYNSCIVW